MFFNLNFFRSSHFHYRSNETYRCSLGTTLKMQPFLCLCFCPVFCPCFCPVMIQLLNIRLSDLCKFNISLLSSRFSSCFKVNFLPHNFVHLLHSPTGSHLKYAFELRQNLKHPLTDLAFISILLVLQI